MANQSEPKLMKQIEELHQDIAALKKEISTLRQITEKNLEESLQRFSDAFHRSPIPLAILKFTEEITGEINKDFASQFGYSQQEVSESEFSIFTLVLNENKLIQGIAKLQKDGLIRNYPLQMVTKDGQVRNMLISGSRTGSVEEQQYIITFNDITDQLRASNALLQNQKRFDRAEEIGRVGNWEYNPANAYFWGSNGAKRIYGFPINSDNFSTGEVENCIPERERVHQALVDLIENDEDYDLVFEIHTQDNGTRKTIHSIAEVERDSQGNPLLVTGIIRDITEEKKAEEKLRESNRRFSAIFHYSPLPIALTRFDNNKFAAVNQAWLTFTGYQKMEVIGKDVAGFNLYEDPDQRVQMIEKIHSVGKVDSLEIRMRKKSGEIADVLFSAEKITLEGEEFLLSLAHDISVRKQLENQLRASRDHSKLLAKRVITVQENERRSISRELHDNIGQALAAIDINLELLKSEIPHEAHPLVNQLDGITNLVHTSLDDLRHLAHELRPPALDAIGLNNTLKNMCYAFGERNGVEIQFQGSSIEDIPDLIQITLYRFAQEALDNANAHAKAKNINVELRTEPNCLTLKINYDGFGFDSKGYMENNDLALDSALRNLQERLGLIGGELEIISSAGEETTLIGRVQLEGNKKVAALGAGY